MKITKSQLAKLVKEELDSGDWSDEQPASRRGHLGDAITDVLEEALLGYLVELGMERKEALYTIQDEIEEKLNDVAIELSHVVGQRNKFGHSEMYEGKKKK